MSRLVRFRFAAATALVLVALVSGASSVVAGPAAPRAAEYPWCANGTPLDRAPQRVASGGVILVKQTPEVVNFAYRGRIRLEIYVLGDHDSVDFHIDSFSGGEDFSVRRKRRMQTPSGQTISVFKVKGRLGDWVRVYFNRVVDVASPIQFTDLLYLGPPDSQQPIYMPVMVLPKALESSPVVRRGGRLQYASNLINVAVPDLYDRQLDAPGSYGFDREDVVQLVNDKLGAHEYDDYGFGLWQHLLAFAGAVHYLPSEQRGPYSVFASAAFPVYQLWNHEIDHNWNFRYDLPRLAGWDGIPFDGFHSGGTVAKEPGYLCCGAYPIRRVHGQWRTVWQRDTHPFHPLELFAMGLIDESQVPDMFVFKRQDLRDYLPDEPMLGPVRKVTVEDVIAVYGMPEGAGQSTWHVAPILLSEKLLPESVISALNFYMRRLEDPDGNVPESFDADSRGLMDLQTSIVVDSGPRPAPPSPVAFPTIGRRDIPGLVLDEPLPGCIAPGDTLVVKGRRLAGAGSLDTLTLEPSDPDTDDVEGAFTMRSGKRFRAEATPTVEDVYDLVLDPLWPSDEPGQVSVSPIYVSDDCGDG